MRLGLLEDLRRLGLGLGVRRRGVVGRALGEVRRAGLHVLEEGLEAVGARGPDGDGRLALVDEHEEALVAQGEGDAARGLADGVAVFFFF